MQDFSRPLLDSASGLRPSRALAIERLLCCSSLGLWGFRLLHGVSAVRTVGLLEWLQRGSMGPWSRLYTLPCNFEEADGVDGNLVTLRYTSCQASCWARLAQFHTRLAASQILHGVPG